MRHKFRFVPSVPRHAPKERNATAGGGGRRFDKRRDFAQFLFFFLFHFDSFASISCIRAMKKRGNVCFWTRKLREDIINIGTIFNTYILLIIETLVGYNVQCKMCNIRNWMIVSPLREALEFARSFLQIFTTTTMSREKITKNSDEKYSLSKNKFRPRLVRSESALPPKFIIREKKGRAYLVKRNTTEPPFPNCANTGASETVAEAD